MDEFDQRLIKGIFLNIQILKMNLLLLMLKYYKKKNEFLIRNNYINLDFYIKKDFNNRNVKIYYKN